MVLDMHHCNAVENSADEQQMNTPCFFRFLGNHLIITRTEDDLIA